MKGQTKYIYEYKSFYDYFSTKWVIKIRCEFRQDLKKWVLFSSKLYDTQECADLFINRELKNRHDLWQK